MLKSILYLLVISLFLHSCQNKRPENNQPERQPQVITKDTAPAKVSYLPEVPDQTVPNSLLYEVINACLADKNVVAYNCRYINNRQDTEAHYKGLRYIIEKNDSLFSRKDQKSLRAYTEHWRRDFSLDPARLNGYTLIDVDMLHKQYGKQFSSEMSKRYDGKFLDIYLPAFSVNKEYAMMAVGYYGPEKGEGNAYILKKSVTGWHVVKIVPNWTSGRIR